MTQKKYTQSMLLAALFCLSLGGWLLHLRIHSPETTAANYIPFISGIISVVIIPLLFLFRKTIHWGYVLNGMTVIIGTITMAHYSIKNIPENITVKVLMLYSTFPDIILAWVKLFIGKALFDLVLFGHGDNPKRGLFLRYPNMGWWFIHLVAMGIIYALGNHFWR